MATRHREPTTVLAHYADAEGARLELLIVARRDVDTWTAEVRRCQTMLDFSRSDPSQPPEARRGCQQALDRARGRLATARARVATLEHAVAAW